MSKETRKIPPVSTEAAAQLAHEFVAFVASDDERLQRFMALSGIDSADLRSRLHEPAFLGFILDFALQDEEQLLAFAAHVAIAPEAIMRARHKLPGAQLDF